MSTTTEITTEEIKHICGWNEVTLQLHLANGLHEAQTAPDLYDARKVVLWYRDNVARKQLAEGDDGGDLDIIAHRARYEKARAQKYVIKLEKLRSGYVTYEEAEFAILELGQVFSEIIEELPAKLAAKIAGQNEDTMLVETDQLVRGILLDYSRGGSDGGD